MKTTYIGVLKGYRHLRTKVVRLDQGVALNLYFGVLLITWR